jgi:hypothetical protein
MEKDLASLNISNKAKATLGAKAFNGALHDDTSFLTWALIDPVGRFTTGWRFDSQRAGGRRVMPASSSVVQRHASWAPRAWARASCELPIHRFLDHLGQAILNEGKVEVVELLEGSARCTASRPALTIATTR